MIKIRKSVKKSSKTSEEIKKKSFKNFYASVLIVYIFDKYYLQRLIVIGGEKYLKDVDTVLLLACRVQNFCGTSDLVGAANCEGDVFDRNRTRRDPNLHQLQVQLGGVETDDGAPIAQGGVDVDFGHILLAEELEKELHRRLPI